VPDGPVTMKSSEPENTMPVGPPERREPDGMLTTSDCGMPRPS